MYFSTYLFIKLKCVYLILSDLTCENSIFDSAFNWCVNKSIIKSFNRFCGWQWDKKKSGLAIII